MGLKGFLNSLLTTLVSGAFTAAATTVAGGHFTGKQVGLAALAGGLAGLANLFRSSPTAK